VPQAGDAASAIAGADVVLDAEYATPTQQFDWIVVFHDHLRLDR
jgi:hypothetical protein